MERWSLAAGTSRSKEELKSNLDLEFVFLFKAVSRSASAICWASLLLKNWVVI